MSDSRMTYRERRLARAERLRGWADGRDVKAEAVYAAADEVASRIPMGQPILVGHHSERGHRADIARIERSMNASIENSAKADSMRSKAENIEHQAKRSIYSDDSDAVERLTAKLAGMEAQRNRYKAANAAFRKEHCEELKGMTAYQRGQAVPFPSYAITNLTGNIGRTRDRLEGLKREKEHGPADRIISARFGSECADCGATIERGQQIRYNKQQGARCMECES